MPKLFAGQTILIFFGDAVTHYGKYLYHVFDNWASQPGPDLITLIKFRKLTSMAAVFTSISGLQNSCNITTQT